MSETKRNQARSNVKLSAPAQTLEGREQQLIAMAMDEAERQILSGTASSQLLTHFVKQGTVKHQLELEKIKHENALLQAKKESLEAAKRSEELFERALKAMSRYSGNGDEEYDR